MPFLEHGVAAVSLKDADDTELCVPQGSKVVGITIHDFLNAAPPRIAPDHPRFHGQLQHVRECLEQAVLRIIYGTPFDGENAVAAEDIARGAAQFAAAMY